MIKLLKSKLKYIKHLKNCKDSQDIINKEKLEIYSIILGYYCYTKDKDIFNLLNHDMVDYITEKIQKLLNTNKSLVNTKDNTMDSMKICIKQLIESDEKNKDKYESVLNNFTYGYEYNEYYRKKHDSVIDYLILQKYSNINKKLIKLEKKMI